MELNYFWNFPEGWGVRTQKNFLGGVGGNGYFLEPHSFKDDIHFDGHLEDCFLSL